jgi:hypothetical protein
VPPNCRICKHFVTRRKEKKRKITTVLKFGGVSLKSTPRAKGSGVLLWLKFQRRFRVFTEIPRPPPFFLLLLLCSLLETLLKLSVLWVLKSV